MTEQGRHVPNETPPSCYRPGDYGKYQGTWFALPPKHAAHVHLLRGVNEWKDSTISSEMPGWSLEHGMWRPK